MDIVVIVDNDARWIDNYKRMLAPFQEELQCMYFRDSEGAMEYMASHAVAVMVSELELPLMSGRELFEMADMLSPDTVKIAVTHVADVSKTLDALNYSNIFKIILKPFFLVEDIIVPIQTGITQYRALRQEEEFCRRAQQELQSLNQRVEELWEKLADKKWSYDRICRMASNIMAGNLKPQISGLSQVESEFVVGFCEKLLQEFVQYSMYEKQNFIYYVNYLKNEFHHPRKSCFFQLDNQTGGQIPGTVMCRIAYGMFLWGYLCWQCLETYRVENVIDLDENGYILKILYQYPESGIRFKIKSGAVRKLLQRIVRDLEYALSDQMEEYEAGQGIAVKLYFKRGGKT